MSINRIISLSSNRTTNNIRDSNSFTTHRFCKFQSSNCISRLTRLRNKNWQGIRINNRISITKFWSNINFHRYSTQFFNSIFTTQTSMHSSTTSNNINFINRLQIIFCQRQLRKFTMEITNINPWTNCLSNSSWLFINLLRHKISITIFFTSSCIPFNIASFFRQNFQITIIKSSTFIIQNNKLQII